MLKQTKRAGFGCQVHLFLQRIFTVGFELRTLSSIPIFCDVCLQAENHPRHQSCLYPQEFLCLHKDTGWEIFCHPNPIYSRCHSQLPIYRPWGRFLLHSPFPLRLSPAPHSVNNISFQGQLQQLLEVVFRRYIVLSAIWNHVMAVIDWGCPSVTHRQLLEN